MAIWQVPFILKSLNKDLLCTDKAFLNSLKELKKFLPERNSWCKTYKQYGDIDSTVIEFDVSEEKIDNIYLRIDLRCIKQQQLKEICFFSSENDLTMEYEDILYDVNLENFIEIFKVSSANKFLKSPEVFLNDL